VTVDVEGDAAHELTETFTVALSAQTNAVRGDSSAVGTILDDEGPLCVSVDDPRVIEGDSGTRAAVYTLRVPDAPAPGQSVSVAYSTAAKTATAGSDFTATSGRLAFDQDSGAARTISVPVSGDGTVEPDETFALNLSAPAGAVIADTSGTATIRNDD
jgi:hypothetical protein